MTNAVRISLILATLAEAKPFIQGLGLRQEPNQRFPVFVKNELLLMVCGIGKVNAAMGTTFCCLTHHPDIVVNLGSAGAMHPAFSVGDVFQISKIYELDHPDLKSGIPVPLIPDTLPGFKDMSIATQDQPVLSPDLRKRVSLLAGLADMEAAAVLRVCSRFGIRCLIYKFVSDTPQHFKTSDIVHQIKAYRDDFFMFFSEHIINCIKNNMNT